MINLVDIFASLKPPIQKTNEDNLFSTAIIIKGEQHRIGKDAQDKPVLLFSTDSTKYPSPPIVLEHLAILHDTECHITDFDGTSRKVFFTLVRCTSDDVALHTYFLHMASSIVASLASNPSQKDISTTINRLIELFRTISKPSKKTIQAVCISTIFVSNQLFSKALFVKKNHVYVLEDAQ